MLRFVDSKFKKSHPAEELGAKKLFDIVATQIFLRRLQEGSGRDAYNYICGQLHDVWDVNSALCLAKSYIDRTKSDSPDPVSDNSTFFGRSNQKPGQGGKNQGQKFRNSPKESKPDQK